jgi:hypothetical protein
MIVGNDVVDLDDPECRLESLHPRWVGRVFTGTERAALEGSTGADRQRLHWALWAAKESSFKARRRLEPTVAFSPRAFAVALGPLPAADGVAAGRVAHRDGPLAVEIRFEGACLHAVSRVLRDEGASLAADAGAEGGIVLNAAARADGEPSLAARRLAVAEVGAALREDPARLRVTGRPPVLQRDGTHLATCLSLSHHGRFVAVACHLPPRA